MTFSHIRCEKQSGIKKPTKKHPFGCLNIYFSQNGRILMPFSPTSTSILWGPRTGFLTGSCEGAYASQIFLLTKQTNFNTFVCLLLVCSFSPKVQKYLLGSLSPIKRREFDEIVVFSAGSEKSSVLGVHDFSGSAEKAKYRELSPFCLIVLVLK